MLKGSKKHTSLHLTEVEDGAVVVIEWIDAQVVSMAWGDDFPTDVCAVKSVGFLVRVDEDQLFYASDRFFNDDKDATIVHSVHAIPLGCIREVTVLKDV